MAALAPAGARAQGKLDAHYEVTLAGIPIGKGSWVVEIGETQYSASASGVTTGLIRVFIGGEGTSSVHGTVNGGKLVSSIYASTIKTRKKSDQVRLVVANGNVKEFKIDPPLEKDPERVPVTEAHERGIIDPMSGSLLRVPGTGDMLTPEACNKRTLAVFDGRLRYDLAARLQAHRARQGATRAMPARRWSARSISRRWPASCPRAPPSSTSPSSATSRSGWRRSPAPACWCRSARRGRPRSAEFKLEAREFVSVAGPVRASVNGAKTQ